MAGFGLHIGEVECYLERSSDRSLLGLAGCVGNPPTSVHQPMTVKPVERKVLAPVDGRFSCRNQ